MTPGTKPLIAGNWKMNGTVGSLAELAAMTAVYDAAMADLRGRWPNAEFDSFSSSTRTGIITVGCAAGARRAVETPIRPARH